MSKYWKRLKQRKKDSLTTRECFIALQDGYILQNEHGFTVKSVRGRQIKSNPRRQSRDYKFDYPTWLISGKLGVLDKVKNYFWDCCKEFK